MNLAQWTFLLSITLFAAIVACLEVSYRAGHRSSQKYPELTERGLGTIEAAVFALAPLFWYPAGSQDFCDCK
jgi:hypothetical protein